MRRMLGMVLLAGVVASSHAAAESRPLTAEEQDLLIYLQSVSAPAMQEVCEPLYKTMPGTNEQIAAWIEQNHEAIARARTAQTARLKRGETIEHYEDGVRKHFELMLLSVPPEKTLRQCFTFTLMARPMKPKADSPAAGSDSPAAATVTNATSPAAAAPVAPAPAATPAAPATAEAAPAARGN